MNMVKSTLLCSLFSTFQATALLTAVHAEDRTATPTLSNGKPAETSCDVVETVTLVDATPNATVYYTLDGGKPGSGSMLYQSPVTLAANQTLRAVAIASGYEPSEVVSATQGKLVPCDAEVTEPTTQRKFLIHVPVEYSIRHSESDTSPLLMDIHGWGDPKQMRTAAQVAGWEKTHSGEYAVSESRGFIAVWPEGDVTDTWQVSWDGYNCCGAAYSKGLDDVPYLKGVIDWVKANAWINNNRVYVHGFSNGAQMAHKFTCQAPEYVSAMAAVSFPINTTAEVCDATYKPKGTYVHPVPVMEVHGTSDQTVCYNGLGAPDCSSNVPTTSAADGATVWRSINGCDATTPTETPITYKGITYTNKITKIKARIAQVGCTPGLFRSMARIIRHFCGPRLMTASTCRSISGIRFSRRSSS